MKSFRVSPLLPRSPLEALGFDAFHATFRLVLRTLYRMSLADTHPLPDGAVILAANHRSFIDPLVLGQCTERRTTFMMKGKYYDIPALNWFFRMSRCIIVDSEKDNRSTLRAAKDVLAAGGVLGIFPEGHISDDGELQAGQAGVAWLARRTGAPVYPVHIGGTREALRKHDKRMHLSHITLRMGAPLSIDAFPDTREGADAFTAALMDSIRALGARDLRRR
ncbi:MAG TPA: lysophospholipid acyltransferase family protein [Planctomycetota bacterium]|nr:lysophospholipid acyltransferase family protein [Planctomycetota bacterium]